MKKMSFRISFVLLAVCLLWCLSITIRFPFIGIYTELNQQEEWLIKELDSEGVSAKLDLQVGDRILKVDGQTPDEFPSIRKSRVIEQAHNIKISREGIEREVVIDKSDAITTLNIAPLVGGALSLFMTLLLATKMRHSPSARMLSFVFLTCGTIWISLGASIRTDPIGGLLIETFMMALQVIFLHFLFVFFKEKGNLELPTRMLKYLYAIVISETVYTLLCLIPSISKIIRLPGSPQVLIFFTIILLINIFILSRIYFNHRKEKSPLATIIKSVLICMLISFMPFVCLSVLPKLLIGYETIVNSYTSIFILFLPISFTYLIASDQLYDISVVLRRILFAIIIALVPCSLFTGLFALIFPDEADLKHLFFILFTSVALVATILYSAEYFTTRLESFMFPRKYILRTALKKMSLSLEMISSFRELKDLILVDIVETLEVQGGAIVFQYKDTIETIYEGNIRPDEVEKLIRTSSLVNHTSYTNIEINRHEEYTSYLILTRKKTNTLLGKEELQWLHLITAYLAISLENIHLMRKLTQKLKQLASQLPSEQGARDIQWFRKLVFELQEEERIRIATDLHDTTMQDLFFLKRRLTSLIHKYSMKDEDLEQLHEMINFIELINTNLRQNCFELNPYMLSEMGLIRTVEKLLDEEAPYSSFNIQFLTENAEAIEKKELIIKRHIFRIVQELLNNAKKHSQSTQVTFNMSIRNQSFYLLYEDDGIGFQNEAITNPNIGNSGIGMEQMKGRVHYLNGQFQLHSAKDSGVKIQITIPMKEALSA
ncbi:hypothetical protein GK047_24375 [Paenibacillus sp. SYP-B3998]|uniref:histidine kinase n=1 Tax=Paenibacillus sp. SYP-B3998 TaxID=2678564 RepID=A0A6G4A3P0_9BACL|nr:ATP-binding protein [Paenibacillus sp. SYP-B3998]NEW09116.1 hypothetical protein [Paenibacillus sp. SYP-B3998]